MFNAYRPYPPLMTVVDAAREMVSLIRGGQAAADMRHTFAVTDVLMGGSFSLYPGAPGGGAGATALTVADDAAFADLEHELQGLQANPSSLQAPQAQGAQASAIDPGQIQAWLAIIMPLLDVIRKWRQGRGGSGTTPNPNP